MGKPKRRGKGKKDKGPFKYTRGGPDPYHSLLNFIKTQAHDNQVNSLLQQLSQAQTHAKNARREALDEAFADVRPMQVDRAGQSSRPHAPPPPDVPMRGAREQPAIPNLRVALGQHMNKRRADRAARAARERPQDMEWATHIAHTTEPAVAAEIFRFAASGPSSRRPYMALATDENEFARRRLAVRGAEHGGIPDPEETAAYRQAVLEMRSRDDAARSGFVPFGRVSTGYDFQPAGRDFKAARVNGPYLGGDTDATYGSYLDSRLRARE